MSTSGRVIIGLCAAGVLTIGIMAGRASSGGSPVYAPQTDAQGAAMIAQATQLMRQQAEDNRRLLQEEADANRQTLRENAQAIRRVMDSQATASQYLLRQTGSQMDNLVRVNTQFTNGEAQRQASYAMAEYRAQQERQAADRERQAAYREAQERRQNEWRAQQTAEREYQPPPSYVWGRPLYQPHNIGFAPVGNWYTRMTAGRER